MVGAIPAWVLLAHDSRNNAAAGLLAGIRWMGSGDNDWGAHYRDRFNLLRVRPQENATAKSEV